jgi:beta-glucanase (GH16 family)
VNYHSGFHTYAVEWDATTLRFYVDGEMHYALRETSDMPIFENPMNIILNLAVGGDFGGDPNGTTVFPQHMDVDYVRVWEKQTGLSGDYNADGAVDAADYVMWRKSDGQNGLNLPADGSGNGNVDAADYAVWRANFSIAESASSMGLTPVPEPSALASLATIAFCRALATRCFRSLHSHATRF